MHRYYTNFNLKQISYAKNNALCAKYIETSQIELIKALLINVKCYFVGNTSKLFFQFDYKDITIVKNVINEAKIINKYLIVNSGTSLKFLGDFCLKNCISNFEKIMTIPGFVGGSIFNNATFLDQGINDNLLYLIVIDKNGMFRLIKKEEIKIEYRKIIIQSIGNYFFIYKAIFRIKNDSYENIKQKKEEAFIYRREHQPKIHCLGSTFKNLETIKAYQLIDKYIYFSGYKGFYICKTHKNFISIGKDLDNLNLVKLIERIQEVLYNNIGIFLETEIKIIY